MKAKLLALILGGAIFVSVSPSYAASSLSRDDFKIYLETRDALRDERVQAMPEGRRLREIAKRNFKLSEPALQAILDKVEAEGGEQGVAAEAKKAIEEALAGTALKDRILEVRVDTDSPHVVAYIKWTGAPDRVLEEAVLVALKAGSATAVPSTLQVWSVDQGGEDLWLARIGADRTRNIREDRIEDWAETRYVRLFEVDRNRSR